MEVWTLEPATILLLLLLPPLASWLLVAVASAGGCSAGAVGPVEGGGGRFSPPGTPSQFSCLQADGAGGTGIAGVGGAGGAAHHGLCSPAGPLQHGTMALRVHHMVVTMMQQMTRGACWARARWPRNCSSLLALWWSPPS